MRVGFFPALIIVFAYWIHATIGVQIGFPFNSQVPQIAQVGRPYLFDLSPVTFRADSGVLEYSLGNAPSWLHINSQNGSLFGTPTDGDSGSPQFSVIGSDSKSTVTIPATLIVSSDPGPQIASDVAESFIDMQSNCGLRCVQYPPRTPFTFSISKGLFQSSSDAIYYYATLADHAPLPSWITFDASGPKFSGTTPDVNKIAQRLDIILIASTVSGFSGVKVPFTVLVTAHRFYFDKSFDTQDISAGENVNISNLKNQLNLDAGLVNDSDYGSAVLHGRPPWMTFDPQTISLSGSAPKATDSFNVTIVAHDNYGDAAFLNIQFYVASSLIFTGVIGVINATAGMDLTYKLSRSDFSRPDYTITMNLGTASKWLTFDASTLTIKGVIPPKSQSETVNANMTVISPDGSIRDFHKFQIHISQLNNINMTSRSAPTSSSSSKSAGFIAGVTIAGVVAFGIILVLLFCLWHRRHRSRNSVTRRPSVFKRMISRPIPQRTADTPITIGDHSNDLEAGSPLSPLTEQAPQITLNHLQHSPRKSFRFSGLGWINPERVSKRKSKIVSKHSQNSLDSVIINRPPWAHDSFHAQYAARMMSPPTHPQYIREIHSGEPKQPITWANAVSDSHYARRHTGTFPVARRMAGVGHGQLFDYGGRQSYYHLQYSRRPISISEGAGYYLPSPPQYLPPTPVRYRSRSSITPPPNRKLLYPSPRRTLTGSSTSSSYVSRPVSRRNPQHSAFFASGGGLHRRMSSAAGRRFAAVGLGLDTIQDSPGLGTEDSGSEEVPGDRDYFATAPSRSNTATFAGGSSRYWDTTDSGTSNESILEEMESRRLARGKERVRPHSDSTWGGRSGYYGTSNSIGRTTSHASSVYSRDSMGAAMKPSRSQSQSPTKSLTYRHTVSTPIMERTRSAYRVMRDRTPLGDLGPNVRRSSKRATRKNEKGEGKAVVKKTAQRPVTLGVNPIGSLRGDIIGGNEAFI